MKCLQAQETSLSLFIPSLCNPVASSLPVTVLLMGHLGCNVYIKITPLTCSWFYFYLQASLLKAHFSANLVLLMSQALRGGKEGGIPAQRVSAVRHLHRVELFQSILNLGLCHHGTLPDPGTQGQERTGVWARRRLGGSLITRCSVPLTRSLSLSPASWPVSYEAGECLVPCIWPWNAVMLWIWARMCCWLCDWAMNDSRSGEEGVSWELDLQKE